MTKNQIPREGDIYKTLTVAEREFVIRYGYYTEDESRFEEPIPIFPDLKNSPMYTSDGKRLTTVIQDPCENYRVRDGNEPDGWCADCVFYSDPQEEIAVCNCPENIINEER